MAKHLQAALQYHKAGFRVVPTGKDKRPINLLERHGYKWQTYQNEQTEQDVKDLFSKDCHGIATLTGVNGLEVIDIDCKYALSEGMEVDYLKLIDELGGVSLLDLTIATTPNKGWHVFYRCDNPESSTDLAQRPLTDEEKQIEPNQKCKVLFETKGVGGLITITPTEGYKVDIGKMSAIPKITMAQRAILLNAARSFNQYLPAEKVAEIPRQEKKELTFLVDGKSSWDDYNEKTDAISLLENYGWKVLHERGNRVYLRRPGKREGTSGDFNKSLGLFKSWSTSTPFDVGKAYTAYGIYTVLEHNGNWSASAKALSEKGFGEKSTIGRQPEYMQPLTPKQQKEPSEIDAILRLRKYDYFNKPKNIDFILSANVDGVKYDVGGLGMLGLVTGLEKSRKTTFLKALIASMLEDGKRRINFSLALNGRKAIFVDTEQPEQFFHRTQTHAHTLAGIRGNTPIYDAYSFRDLTIEERIECTEHLIKTTENLGLLVLDGVLDLVKNFNDEAQCQALVHRLMKWTAESNAMIMTVIHEGKGTGFMMGHLGSALARKCDFAIKMTHNSDTQFTEVSSKLGRTKPFPSFEFTQDDEGYPILNHLEKAIEQPIYQQPIFDGEKCVNYNVVTPDKSLDEIPF